MTASRKGGTTDVSVTETASGAAGVPPDCACPTCTAYRERASRAGAPAAGPHGAEGLRPRTRPPRVVDAYTPWRRQRLPWRVAGAVVGVLLALASPALSRRLLAAVGLQQSVVLHDFARMSIAALVALPLLRLIAYRRRDALLIAFVPVVGVFLMGLIGWRLPVVRHPDWPLRPDDVRQASAPPPPADPAQ